MKLSSHHVFVIEGSMPAVQAELLVMIERKFEIRTRGNPDVWIMEFNSFGVDDSRRLALAQSKKAVKGDTKVFVFSFNSITSEAQNALLKVLEEPTAGTRFFMIVPTAEMLLPTLRSRVEMLQFTEAESVPTESAKRFLSAGASERLKSVADIVENKDKAAVRELLNGIETLLHAQYGGNPMDTEMMFVFKELQNARKYLEARSPSYKLILEHLSLIIPTLPTFRA